jgi:hypothetical protein
MNSRSTLRPFGLFWLPVLLLLLVRALVAPGWMADFTTSETLTVRICSDADRIGQTVEIPFERTADYPDDEAEQSCAWGALAESSPLPATPALASRVEIALNRRIPLPALGFAPGSASPLPPSTGPPITA